MRLVAGGSVAAIVVCLLVAGLAAGSEDHHHGHHHRQGKKHGRGHHTHSDPGQDAGNRLDAAPNELEIHMMKIGWLNVPRVVGCRCRSEGAICIKGPDGKPTCVQKHHLKQSVRLFKHYHELKEKAEEDLNEVDPPPHHMLQDAPHHDAHHAPHHAVHGAASLDAPHDMHISVSSQHESDASSPHTQHFPHDLKLQHGKEHARGNHHAKRTQNHSISHSASQQTMQKLRCDNATLDEMRRRLTGWFHLLHGNDHRRHHGDRHHRRSHRHLSVKKELREGGSDGHCRCLRSVMWEFHQLDVDHSRSLSKAEVKVIDNNDMEPCLHPYLLTCDTNRDHRLSHREWCCCFPQKESESPCYARLDEMVSSKDTESYVPSCDGEGYYHREQCMGGLSAQTCWCVTPTGAEIPGSRTVGRAHCSKLEDTGIPQTRF